MQNSGSFRDVIEHTTPFKFYWDLAYGTTRDSEGNKRHNPFRRQYASNLNKCQAEFRACHNRMLTLHPQRYTL